MTCKLIFVQAQILQIPKVPHGLGDAPCGKRGQKKSKLGWLYGTDHSQNEEKMTCKLIVV